MKKLLKKFIKNQYISDSIFTNNHIKDVFIEHKKEIEIFTNGYIKDVSIEHKRDANKEEYKYRYCPSYAEVVLTFGFGNLDSFLEFNKKMKNVHEKRKFKIELRVINENN